MSDHSCEVCGETARNLCDNCLNYYCTTHMIYITKPTSKGISRTEYYCTVCGVPCYNTSMLKKIIIVVLISSIMYKMFLFW